MVKDKLKINCLEIEEAVARMYGFRQNIIVPNISWGANLHECDLIIINKSGFATEVEIKISKADLKKDFTKGHNHINEKIKHLYYAIPVSLVEFAETIIPVHAGIISCDKLISRPDREYEIINNEIVETLTPGSPVVFARFHRHAQAAKQYRKMTDEEINNISRLGCMRIWGLKSKLIKERNKSKLK